MLWIIQFDSLISISLTTRNVSSSRCLSLFCERHPSFIWTPTGLAVAAPISRFVLLHQVGPLVWNPLDATSLLLLITQCMGLQTQMQIFPDLEPSHLRVPVSGFMLQVGKPATWIRNTVTDSSIFWMHWDIHNISPRPFPSISGPLSANTIGFILVTGQVKWLTKYDSFIFPGYFLP